LIETHDLHPRVAERIANRPDGTEECHLHTRFAERGGFIDGNLARATLHMAEVVQHDHVVDCGQRHG
jgi:hypothetical protein